MRLDSALKKSRPQYISAQKILTLLCTACNCQIIFRCASIHGRAGFILVPKKVSYILEIRSWNTLREELSPLWKLSLEKNTNGHREKQTLHCLHIHFMAENHDSMCLWLLSNYDSVACDLSKHYSENDLYVRIGACNKNISSHLIIVALSVLDSFPCLQFDRFHEIARVFCSLGFYLQNTTSLDQSKKNTMLRIKLCK